MIRTPAHKQTEEAKLPGQIVTAPDKAPGVTKDFDCHPYLKTSTADQTLGDYYKRKTSDWPVVKEAGRIAAKQLEYGMSLMKKDAPKKLTFEEWANCMPSCLEEYRHEFEQCWQEAQKNV